jgi:hypothetical protein
MIKHGSYPTSAVHGEVEVSARSRLIIAIENYIRSRAPGYLEYLDIILKSFWVGVVLIFLLMNPTNLGIF